MQGSVWSFLVALLAVASPTAAQESQISIVTEPAGISYLVDGQTYHSASTFVWPKGSKHTIQMQPRVCNGSIQPMDTAGYQYDTSCRVRYSAPAWTSNKGPIAVCSPQSGRVAPCPPDSVIVTADPEITFIKMTASVDYRVSLAMIGKAGPNPEPIRLPHQACVGGPVSLAPGVGCVNGACYDQAVELWLPKGRVELQAFPNSGFAFVDWIAGNSTLLPPSTSFDLTGPTIVAPHFTVAKRVRVMTDPPELKVLVDRQEIRTIDDPKNYPGLCPMPGFFDFRPDSVHVFGALSPQMNDSNGGTPGVWIFDRWSNGGEQNMVYRATDTSVVDTLVAKFVRGIQVNFSVPRGLKLLIDGRDNWPVNAFVWAAGSKHVITAPSEQFDENGRKYIFKRWAHGGDATQEIVVDPNAEFRLNYTAEYEMLGMLLVQSGTPGTSVEVEGVPCPTPCTVHQPVGTKVRITAPKSLPVRDGERLDFVAWKDMTIPERSVDLGAEPVLLSMSYRTMYRLDARPEPANSATLRLEPSAPDGYYPYNAQVQVFSTAQSGYKFKGWRGDVSGPFSPVTLNIGGPRTAVAVYEPVPHIAPAGVRNAAGETPESGVAAGSIVSIFGGMLAERSESLGQQNRLAQSLGGTAVVVDGSILPLFFASPEQINAQLPADLAEGTHTLRVRNSAVPDQITAEFTVVRNAPGLFTTEENGSPKAMAMGSDGKLIGAANPAEPGDVITLLGTGFGPSRVPPPEGFGVEERPEYRLLDRTEVLIGETSVEPLYAGAGGGIPGITIVRFRLPESTQATDQDVFVRVNNRPSNTVRLRIQSSAAKSESGEEEHQ